MIINFSSYINESVYKDEFLRLYNLAPQSLKDEVNKTKDVKQSIKWHPEGDAFTHIRLVTNRLANCFNDINLTISGFFHDLGKTYMTSFSQEKNDWTARGHEDVSVEILDRYQDWVKEQGGNLDIIRYIVANHMRYKFLDEMGIQSQIKFLGEPYFSYVEKFNTADYGGNDLNCKQVPENKELTDKIEKYYEIERENKIISNRFNGTMVMNKYPHLKGPKLGKVLGDFKKSFDDFRSYVLNNSSEKIMKSFDEFMKNVNEGVRELMKPKTKEEQEIAFSNLIKDINNSLSDYPEKINPEFQEIADLFEESKDNLHLILEDNENYTTIDEYFKELINNDKNIKIIEFNETEDCEGGRWICYPDKKLAQLELDIINYLSAWIFSKI
jgi:hypothetical protein